MSGKARNVLVRHLFLLIGLFTLGLFYLVAVLDRTGAAEAAGALAVPMRVLIVPMYLVWLVLTMAQVALFGPSGWPAPIAAAMSGITMAAGLAPYALADYLLDRRRRRRSRKTN